MLPPRSGAGLTTHEVQQASIVEELSVKTHHGDKLLEGATENVGHPVRHALGSSFGCAVTGGHIAVATCPAQPELQVVSETCIDKKDVFEGAHLCLRTLQMPVVQWLQRQRDHLVAQEGAREEIVGEHWPCVVHLLGCELADPLLRPAQRLEHGKETIDRISEEGHGPHGRTEVRVLTRRQHVFVTLHIDPPPLEAGSHRAAVARVRVRRIEVRPRWDRVPAPHGPVFFQEVAVHADVVGEAWVQALMIRAATEKRPRVLARVQEPDRLARFLRSACQELAVGEKLLRDTCDAAHSTLFLWGRAQLERSRPQLLLAHA